MNAFQYYQSTLKRFCSTNIKDGFSVLEVLFALLVIGILGVSAMRSINALKAQHYSIQKFLLTNANLFEAQLFINRQLDSINPQSIIITPTSIEWKQYKDLFIEVAKGDYMDFYLQTTNASLTLQNNTLYFNNALLLHNVKSMKFWRTHTKAYNILSYRICSSVCITDSILLDEIEQLQTVTKTKA